MARACKPIFVGVCMIFSECYNIYYFNKKIPKVMY